MPQPNCQMEKLAFLKTNFLSSYDRKFCRVLANSRFQQFVRKFGAKEWLYETPKTCKSLNVTSFIF